MPEVSNQTISQGLADQLVNLSRTANESAKNPGLRAAAVRAEAIKTMRAIEAEISSLNVSSGQFAQTIKDLIISADWAKLPPPKQMTQRTEELKAVNDAIREVQQTIIGDIAAIMAILIEIQRKAGLNKADERIQERKATITSAEAEFAKREKAAEEQRIGDLLSAGTQIVSGALGVLGAGKSLLKAGSAARDTGKAWAKTKELNAAQPKLMDAQKKATEHDALIPGAKKIIAKAEVAKASGAKVDTAPSDAAKANIEKGADLKHKVNELRAEQDFKRAEIDQLNTSAQNKTTKARAFQDLWSGISGVMRAGGDMVGAQMKFMASMSTVAAEKEALAKNLAQSGEQAALDAYQQLRDALKSALQMLQAVEQSMSGSFSAIARSI